MSPGAALRLRFLATLRVCLGGDQIPPAARGVDAVDLDLDRVAEPQAAARSIRLQCGAELVQIPPAAQPARWQEALEALLAELDEGALLDQPDDLALEAVRRIRVQLRERALEEERETDVVGVALDLHRLALGCRAQHAGLVEL